MNTSQIRRILAFAMMATTGSIVATSTMAQDTKPETLVKCVPIEGDLFTLTRSDFAHIHFDNKSSEILEVRRDSSAPSNANTTYYTIETLAGNIIQVRLASGQNSELSIWDRGLVGNVCDAAKSTVNRRALDKLVTEAKPKGYYQFAACTATDESGSGETVNVTVRPGMVVGTAVFQATLGEGGEAGKVAYSASRYREEGALGSSYLRLFGTGSHVYSALGTHVHTVKDMWIRTNNESKSVSVYFGLAEGGAALLPLKECKINNLWYVKKILNATSQETNPPKIEQKTFINIEESQRIDFANSSLFTLTNIDPDGNIIGAHPSKFKVQWETASTGRLFSVRFVDEGEPEECGTIAFDSASQQVQVANCEEFVSSKYETMLSHPTCEGETTVEMIQCAGIRYNDADRRLNNVYRVLLTTARKLNNGAALAESIVNSELAWIKSRDANCLAAAAPYEGGSLYSVVKLECAVQETLDRTKFLKRELSALRL